MLEISSDIPNTCCISLLCDGKENYFNERCVLYTFLFCFDFLPVLLKWLEQSHLLHVGRLVQGIAAKVMSASASPSAVLYCSFTTQHQPTALSSFVPAAFLLYIEQHSPPPTHAHQLLDRL